MPVREANRRTEAVSIGVRRGEASWISKPKDLRVGGGVVVVKCRVAKTWSDFSRIISLFLYLIKLVLWGNVRGWQQRREKKPMLPQAKHFLTEEVLLQKLLFYLLLFTLLIWPHKDPGNQRQEDVLPVFLLKFLLKPQHSGSCRLLAHVSYTCGFFSPGVA